MTPANVYPACDECSFDTAYAWLVEDSELILCPGCAADQCAKGYSVTLLRRLTHYRPARVDLKSRGWKERAPVALR